MQNTIARAVLWSDGNTISDKDAREAILVSHASAKQDLLSQPMDDDFNLQFLLEKVERHYVQRALEEAHWKKAPAARKLGMKNYQNLSLKMKKYGIE
jgi:DNA-binding NtrC family response regulator